NWGVKFFFPCMDKFTKIHSFKQVLIYLVELCNKHSGLARLPFSFSAENTLVILSLVFISSLMFSATLPSNGTLCDTFALHKPHKKENTEKYHN
ncbi:hypothetical protein LIT13_13400, partial [Flavobacterium psychrophilum]